MRRVLGPVLICLLLVACGSDRGSTSAPSTAEPSTSTPASRQGPVFGPATCSELVRLARERQLALRLARANPESTGRLACFYDVEGGSIVISLDRSTDSAFLEQWQAEAAKIAQLRFQPTPRADGRGWSTENAVFVRIEGAALLMESTLRARAALKRQRDLETILTLLTASGSGNAAP